MAETSGHGSAWCLSRECWWPGLRGPGCWSSMPHPDFLLWSPLWTQEGWGAPRWRPCAVASLQTQLLRKRSPQPLVRTRGAQGSTSLRSQSGRCRQRARAGCWEGCFRPVSPQGLLPWLASCCKHRCWVDVEAAGLPLMLMSNVQEGHSRSWGPAEPGVLPPLGVLRDPGGTGWPSLRRGAACLCSSPHRESWSFQAAFPGVQPQLSPSQ